MDWYFWLHTHRHSLASNWHASNDTVLVNLRIIFYVKEWTTIHFVGYIIQGMFRPACLIYKSITTYLSQTSMLAQAQIGVYHRRMLQLYCPTNIALTRQCLKTLSLVPPWRYGFTLYPGSCRSNTVGPLQCMHACSQMAGMTWDPLVYRTGPAQYTLTNLR